MEDNKLLLSDFIRMCLDFQNNPSEAQDKKIKDFLANLEIKQYCKITNKLITIVDILRLITDATDAPTSSVLMETGAVAYGLLPYATNLDNDLGVASTTNEIYDIIKEFGLFDAIYHYVQKDYEDFKILLQQSINFSNIYHLTETMSLMSTEEYDKWIKMIQDLKGQLTPEVIHDLAAINAGNIDVSEITTALSEEALRQAMEKK